MCHSLRPVAVVVLPMIGLLAAPAAADPFRYFIGREVVVVNVVSSVKTTRAIETLEGTDRTRCEVRHSTGADSQAELCVTELVVVTREGTATTRLVPDPTLHADLAASGSAVTDDQMTVELRDGMLLRSINVNSTGRAGDVIVSVARFAGLLTGLPGLWAKTMPLSAPIRPVSDCTPFARPLSDQPDVVRLWLWENQDQCRQWHEIRKLEESKQARVDERLELEHEIRGATDDSLKLLLAKVKAVEEAITNADAVLGPRIEAFNTRLEAYAASLRLGVSVNSQTHDQILNLKDLPTSAGLSAGMPTSDVGQAGTPSAPIGTDTSPAGALWKHARVIVTLDLVAPLDCSEKRSVADAAPAAGRNAMHIYFRQGAPARMRVFIGDQTANPTIATLRVAGERFDNFVHECLPVSSMTFKRSAWSSRDLSLTFDERGRPLKLVRSSESDAAAIAASVASAATTFRDEVAATVAKAVEVQANRRKLDMDDITRRLERVKGEKELIDAQLALASADANFDTTLKQKQAAATLDSLKAELALATAQATGDQSVQIEALKVAVAQINQELELIKAQQALDKARQ